MQFQSSFCQPVCQCRPAWSGRSNSLHSLCFISVRLSRCAALALLSSSPSTQFPSPFTRLPIFFHCLLSRSSGPIHSLHPPFLLHFCHGTHAPGGPAVSGNMVVICVSICNIASARSAIGYRSYWPRGVACYTLSISIRGMWDGYNWHPNCQTVYQLIHAQQ